MWEFLCWCHGGRLLVGMMKGCPVGEVKCKEFKPGNLSMEVLVFGANLSNIDKDYVPLNESAHYLGV